MSQPEIVAQAQAGLWEYRESLINELGDNQGAVDTERIQTVLRGLGLVSKTPLLTVSHNQDSLKRLVALQTEDSWAEPFTAQGLKDALEVRELLDAGNPIGEVGFPTAFYVPLIDATIVFDDVDYNTQLFGPIFAKGAAIRNAAHEIIHSAFANLANAKYCSEDGKTVQITEKTSIGQALEISTVWPGGGNIAEYNPMWIDEAFADYTTADVLEAICPESRPRKGWVTNLGYHGVDEVELPAKYLLFCEQYPDNPGVFGDVSAMGMDILSEKRPWLVPAIRNLSTGKLAIGAFHSKLRNSIGNELTAAITEQRPYEGWGDIFEQIKALT